MSTLLEKITETLDMGKAEQSNVISLTGKSDMADYLVIASGTSARHVGALAHQILEKLASEGKKGIKPEGGKGDEWVVIDALDIIVHLFSPDMRAFYNLDQMWQDIPLRYGSLPVK